MPASMTLDYDKNDQRAVAMLQILLASGLFTQHKSKCGMEQAMDDIREGRVHKMTSVDDFMSAL